VRKSNGVFGPSVRVAKLAVVSVAGIGFLPLGAATAGTLAGALAFLLLQPGVVAQLVLLATAVVLGQSCSGAFASPATRDPQFIVIDEVAGIWLALLALPINPLIVVIGAVLFRVLDKFKPGPIGLVERRGGRWSVMGDDLVAGLCANVILHAGTAAVALLR
jgi:phosphatidylglycerophosphatase A